MDIPSDDVEIAWLTMKHDEARCAVGKSEHLYSLRVDVFRITFKVPIRAKFALGSLVR
jgi:hypothetical protein